MTKQLEQQPSKKGQGKVLLVASLSIVFIIVLMFRLRVFQFSSSHSAISPCEAVNPPGLALVPAVRNESQPVASLPLPAVDINRILKQNPFHGFHVVTADKRKPHGESNGSLTSHEAGRSIQHSGAIQHLTTINSTNPDPSSHPQLSAIITGGLRPTALIGDKLFHENDCLENGWRIVAIQADRIVVQTTP